METLSLGGRWNLRQAGAKGGTLAATVPGNVHTDLIAAGRIPEPFYRDNEANVQWIQDACWIYSRSFSVSPELLASDHVLLCCEGLDTLATISINGKRVASTENMFRSWTFDIKNQLIRGKNSVEVRFDSTIPYIAGRRSKRVLPEWTVGTHRTVTGSNWIRKEPCNYGWDWGPHMITCGIWRPISIVGFSGARLTDVQIRQDHSRREGVALTVAAEVALVRSGDYRALVSVTFKGANVAECLVQVESGRAEASLKIKDPELWWPNGLGSQPLYEVRVSLLDKHDVLLHALTRRIGIRTLRLVRNRDKIGETFFFECNGVPFFAKGANWIPADVFAARVTSGRLRTLVQEAVAANMNMLRCWGGGIYEEDAFYDACDEFGICVWQDFMFACAAYPSFDKNFMRNVKAEAEDNVRRLRHHPCIALWCGNNELEQGLASEKWTKWTMSWKDYSKLFDSLLPEVVKRLDPDGNYWPGSPHKPHGDRKEYANPRWGDAHLWDVWHGRKPFEWYREQKHRFISEFGFQSFPEPKMVRSYTLPEDRNVTSFVMEHHQRNAIGNSLIMTYMCDWFKLPKSFDMTLWLSQILQGHGMKYAVEGWRRNMALTMGALYWQLNDCWPVASWASIDYDGRWKALHYMARRFYAPLLISGFSSNGHVEVHVTSDKVEAVRAVAEWTLTDLAGKTLAAGRKLLILPGLKNTQVCTLDLDRYVRSVGSRNLLVWLDLRVNGGIVSENLVTFNRPKHLELQEPAITSRIKTGNDGAFLVTLKAGCPALWTWVDVDGVEARFSDRFFHLRPGRLVTVEIIPSKPLTAAELRKKLIVRSLADTY